MNGVEVTDNSIYERARLSRDARFDGRFFIGVRTTGIYCRPICPANPPKSDNVLFFASAAAASEAGFRPCLRCRPECAPGSPAWAGTSTTVQRGLRLIADGALDDSDIEHLAARLGVTSRHLRRLFARHVGASPVAVAHTQRLHFAKRLIDQTSLPMKEISVAAGYGSVRRFNDAFRKTYDRSPRELRRARVESEGKGQLRLTLPYREPYDWDRLIGFFAARAIPGLERIIDRRYLRAVRVGDSQGVVEVRDDGGAISLTVHGIGTRSLFPVAQRVRSMFDVDAPIDDIVDVLGVDRILRDRLRGCPGLRVPGAWDGWELAVRAILGQQVSVKAATTLAGRVVETYGPPGTAWHRAQPRAIDQGTRAGAPGRKSALRCDAATRGVQGGVDGNTRHRQLDRGLCCDARAQGSGRIPLSRPGLVARIRQCCRSAVASERARGTRRKLASLARLRGNPYLEHR